MEHSYIGWETSNVAVGIVEPEHKKDSIVWNRKKCAELKAAWDPESNKSKRSIHTIQKPNDLKQLLKPGGWELELLTYGKGTNLSEWS